MYPISGGDPDDAGFVPVPPSLLGAVVAVLSAVAGGTSMVTIALAGGGFSVTALWLTLAGVGFGLALVAWDRLTDRFEESRPGDRWDEPEDDAAEGQAHVRPEQ